jgi:hypothetical protein
MPFLLIMSHSKWITSRRSFDIVPCRKAPLTHTRAAQALTHMHTDTGARAHTLTHMRMRAHTRTRTPFRTSLDDNSASSACARPAVFPTAGGEQTWAVSWADVGCVVGRRGQCRGQRRDSSARALFATKETSETPKSAKGGWARAGVQNSAYSDLQQLGHQCELGELVELHVVLNERPHPATQGVLTGYSRGTQGAELRVVLGRPRQTD